LAELKFLEVTDTELWRELAQYLSIAYRKREAYIPVDGRYLANHLRLVFYDRHLHDFEVSRCCRISSIYGNSVPT